MSLTAHWQFLFVLERPGRKGDIDASGDHRKPSAYGGNHRNTGGSFQLAHCPPPSAASYTTGHDATAGPKNAYPTPTHGDRHTQRPFGSGESPALYHLRVHGGQINRISSRVAVLTLIDNQVRPVPRRGRHLSSVCCVTADPHYSASCLLIRKPEINQDQVFSSTGYPYLFLRSSVLLRE